MGRITTQNHDWPTVQMEYVRGNCTYDDLAKKYLISPDTVEKKGCELKWTEKRYEYRAKVEMKVLEAKAEEMARRLVEHDDSCYAIVEELRARLAGILKEYKGSATIAQVKEMGESLERICKIGRLVCGSYTDKRQVEAPHDMAEREKEILDRILSRMSFAAGKA
jgi:hypothetical protein